MNESTLRKIKSVEARAGYRVLISWFHGPQMTVDLSDMVQRGGVFETLQNETEFFRVKIGERNRVIEWPEPKDEQGYPMIEIDADALHELGMRQKSSLSMRKVIHALQSLERSERPA